MNPKIEKFMPDFEAACKRLNIPAELPMMPNQPQSIQDHHQSAHMLMIFHKDKKCGKTAKYGDAMYFPWWNRASVVGSGFCLGDFGCVYSHAIVGAPFESYSMDDANELADRYKELYEIKHQELTF